MDIPLDVPIIRVQISMALQWCIPGDKHLSRVTVIDTMTEDVARIVGVRQNKTA